MTGIGYEFGKAIYKVEKGYSPLRDLAEVYSYVNPINLPKMGNRNVLIATPHSFSRVFSSAIYALLCRMSDFTQQQNGLPFSAAMKKAGEILSRYLITGASLAAVNENFFDSVAKAMIFVDIQAGEPFRHIMREVFLEFKILKIQVVMQIADDFTPSEIHGNSKTQMLIEKKEEHITLDKELNDNNELLDLKVQVGCDKLSFNSDSSPHVDIVGINPSKDRIKEDVKLCLDFLSINNKVNNPKSSFASWKGNLIRRHFACF